MNRARSIRRWGIAATFVALLLLLLAQFGRSIRESERVIYFEPVGASTGLSDQALSGSPVAKVTSEQDLQLAVKARTPAIWIHREALPQVDQAWLQANYHAGRAIVGIDLDLYELSAALGKPAPQGGWLRRQEAAEPLYTLMARSLRRGRTATWAGESSTSDFLRSVPQVLSIQRVALNQSRRSLWGEIQEWVASWWSPE